MRSQPVRSPESEAPGTDRLAADAGVPDESVGVPSDQVDESAGEQPRFARVTAVLLGLLTAALFGAAGYLGPVLGRTHGPSAVLAWGQVVAVLAIGVAVVLLGSAPPGTGSLLLGLLAGVVNGLALTAMFECARHLRISVMAPIGATGGGVPVVVALLLGEQPGLLQLAGIPLALVGVVLVAAGQRSGRDDGPPGADRGRGLWLAGLWALFYGVFLSLFAEASHDSQVWAVLTSRVALLLTVVVVPLLRGTPLRLDPGALPLVALNGLLILAGVTAFAAATSAGLVSVVSVLATLSPLVTVALAVLVLRERLVRSQRAGLVAAMAGVVLLAAG
jgi:drug/metabolite transporter (DMT)-like permease